jgi:hypothetical protein
MNVEVVEPGAKACSYFRNNGHRIHLCPGSNMDVESWLTRKMISRLTSARRKKGKGD